MNKNTMKNNADFSNWINQLKTKITDARNKLVFSIISHILELYWGIGKEIAEKQQKSVWGSNLVETVAKNYILNFLK